MPDAFSRALFQLRELACVPEVNRSGELVQVRSQQHPLPLGSVIKLSVAHHVVDASSRLQRIRNLRSNCVIIVSSIGLLPNHVELILQDSCLLGYSILRSIIPSVAIEDPLEDTVAARLLHYPKELVAVSLGLTHEPIDILPVHAATVAVTGPLC
jgi:hypothetical protein